MRDLHLLDKDLDRVSNAESAGLHSARPVVRLGLALIFAALAAVLFAGGLDSHAAPGIMLAGGVVAAFLALSIGANDVANSLGPAVGAGALPMGAGLAAVAAMEVAGALLAGERVSDTLTLGILPPDRMLIGTAPAVVMLAAMMAATIWITVATWAGAPVSTTHAVVGGIAGAGLALFGPGALDWSGVAVIALGWIGSPVLSGLLAAAVLAVIRARVHRAPDRLAAARRWLPVLVAVMLGLLVTYAGTFVAVAPAVVALVAIGGAGLAGWAARRRMHGPVDPELSENKQLARLFGLPLAASALLMGFGHGANDAGNVAAPLAVIAQSAASWGTVSALSPWLLFTAGAGIALGAALFGRRLVHMVGSRITRLSPVRALCVSLATAITVLSASRLGLPVSTTHIAVGGVFGVGFYREWEERRFRAARARDRAPLPAEERHRRRLVRRGHVLRTLAAWVVTVPAVAALSAAIAAVIG